MLEQPGTGHVGAVFGQQSSCSEEPFFLLVLFTGTLQNHARKYNLPIDELSFKYNIIPTYRDQAAVIEAAKTVKFGQELPMDVQVWSP